jgi:orotidine-5'-phosphate decarboxylase
MKRAAAALAFTILLAGIGVGRATAGGDVRSLRYREVGGDGPVLIVKGRGCLQSEDSLRLRPTAYVGGDDPLVVYRCVTP